MLSPKGPHAGAATLRGCSGPDYRPCPSWMGGGAPRSVTYVADLGARSEGPDAPWVARGLEDRASHGRRKDACASVLVSRQLSRGVEERAQACHGVVERRPQRVVLLGQPDLVGRNSEGEADMADRAREHVAGVEASP